MPATLSGRPAPRPAPVLKTQGWRTTFEGSVPELNIVEAALLNKEGSVIGECADMGDNEAVLWISMRRLFSTAGSSSDVYRAAAAELRQIIARLKAAVEIIKAHEALAVGEAFDDPDEDDAKDFE